MGNLREKRRHLLQRKKVEQILFLICVVVFIISAVSLFIKWYTEKQAQEKYESLSQTAIEIETESVDVFTELGIDNPAKILDWEQLWKENEDIYGWIYISDTNIDYPILQHKTDNLYYLNYNLDGTKGYPGCIYTENINAKDFSDYNTLIYGHNMKNGTMFADLHKFEDVKFFEEHPYVYVYTPEEVLIYEVYATYEFTNAHILYSYDCFSQSGFEEYLNMVYEEYGDKGNFREEVEVTREDTVITLSTCVSGQNEKRLLVQAVCIGREEL